MTHHNHSFCYKGSITFNRHGVKSRDVVLQAVDEEVLPLSFNNRSLQLMHQFRTTLLKLGHSRYHDDSNSSGVNDSSVIVDQDIRHDSYTVVHWRRGDQLVTRCKKMIDLSPNCHDAHHLIERVSTYNYKHNNNNDSRNYNHNSIIYIATNEPQDSHEMETLRHQGYLTYNDVMMAMSNNPLNPMDNDYPSVFDVLIVEVLLMIDADVFLAWGVSEMNDIVEHQRQALHKTYCVDQNNYPDNNQNTWCSLHHMR